MSASAPTVSAANSTLSYVHEVLGAFLAEPLPGVLALKGEWGVGKTYLWNDFIARQRTAAGCTTYAYASVFGVANVAALRRALFMGLRPLDPAAESRQGWWKKWSGKASRHVNFGVNAVVKVELKNTELWADSVENDALRDMVVCLDDLERKEATLSASALLGFITNLRDERRCKVVLLFNEAKAAANPDFAPVLAEFREKVIDREILLNPTVVECYRLIFTDRRFEDAAAKPTFSTSFQPADNRTLLEIFESVKVSNIRVLRKTRNALEYFEGRMATAYPRLWPVFVRQVVKLCYLHFCHEKAFAVRDVAHQNRWLNIYGRAGKDKERDAEMKKYAPVTEVGYRMQPADRLIVEYLETGFVAWMEATPLLDELEIEQDNVELGIQYRATWDRYWCNFLASQEEVLTAQRQFLHAHHAKISVQEISQVVDFLETFGPAPEEVKLLEAAADAYVSSHPDLDPGLLDMDFRGASKKAAQMLLDRYAKVVFTKPLAEGIDLVTGSESWSTHDLRFLTTYTEDDFLAWLRSSADARLLSRIKVFRERFAEHPAGKPIVARMEAALRVLEKRSELDARRVRDGVGLPPPEGINLV